MLDVVVALYYLLFLCGSMFQTIRVIADARLLSGFNRHQE